MTNAWCGVSDYVNKTVGGFPQTLRKNEPYSEVDFLVEQIERITGMWICQYAMTRDLKERDGKHEQQYQLSLYFGTVNTLRAPELLYWLNPCHKGGEYWEMTVRTDCAQSPINYRIHTPWYRLEDLLEECLKIGTHIQEDQDAIAEEDDNLKEQTASDIILSRIMEEGLDVWIRKSS